MPAEEVVEASLAGLRRGKLFVIPGWRYRVLTSIITKLPAAWRLAVESRTSRSRGRAVSAHSQETSESPPSAAE
jgi:short-subunit dehydrogenase